MKELKPANKASAADSANNIEPYRDLLILLQSFKEIRSRQSHTQNFTSTWRWLQNRRIETTQSVYYVSKNAVSRVSFREASINSFKERRLFPRTLNDNGFSVTFVISISVELSVPLRRTGKLSTFLGLQTPKKKKKTNKMKRLGCYNKLSEDIWTGYT